MDDKITIERETQGRLVLEASTGMHGPVAKELAMMLCAALAAPPAPAAVPPKMWLWKNFVDGRPEYWAFDNPFPIHMDDGDPQTLGEPCGYAIFKQSRNGRTDVPESEVLRRIAAGDKT